MKWTLRLLSHSNPKSKNDYGLQEDLGIIVLEP
jgi:hypothetical protein